MSVDIRAGLIRIRLTPEQALQLAPLAIGAASQQQNVLFVATAIPYWSRQDEGTVWDLQVKTIPAEIGRRLKKLVLSAGLPAGQMTERLRKSRKEASADEHNRFPGDQVSGSSG
jgi:hypothetical protein